MKISKALVSAAIVAASSAALAAPISIRSNVDSSNDFGMRLMLETVRNDARKSADFKNTMISPISAHVAFSMVFNGTAGTTETQMRQTLGFGTRSVDQINTANTELRRLLQERGRRTDSPSFKIANSLWNTSTSRFDFKPDFAAKMKASYGATPTELNFLKAESADVINGWCDTNTNGLVKKIISADDLSQLTWVILNASYFEAAWAEPFQAIHVRGATTFTRPDGKKLSTKLITSDRTFRHANIAIGEVIEIPFVSGGTSEFVMRIVLPKTGTDFTGLNSKSLWTAPYWMAVASALASANPEKGTLTLPSFSFDYGLQMRVREDLTTAMGLDYLFDEVRADFSRMGTVATFVGLIKQNTRIELDEKGVKAAAVTLIGGAERSMPRPEAHKFHMTVDRAFAFAIVDKATDTVLFMGSVVDPTK